MHTSTSFLVAMAIIFTVPYLVWRLGGTEAFAPLVVVQIVGGILLGPGVLGHVYPDYYQTVFTGPVVQMLTGVASWGVTLFVWIAGIELDLRKAWAHRVESGITAGLALGVPLAFGSLAAVAMLGMGVPWMGTSGQTWQFVLGIGMACAVTALPILVLFMSKLDILRQPLGQRILRYASLDDIAIWAVLAVILMDWSRVALQAAFLVAFAVATVGFRRLMRAIPAADRWFVGLVWLALCAFGADASGLHFMVGAFLAGVVMDAEWFDEAQLDGLRHNVLMVLMPVFFLSTGLRTQWSVGGTAVFLAAGLLLAVSVAGKLIGLQLAGRVLGWKPGEASIMGWLLQTKALIMIIFVNVLLERRLITNDTFTALLLMAVGSTMLTMPIVRRKLSRAGDLVLRTS